MKLYEKLKFFWKDISIVDKSVLIFMTILLAQLIFNIVCHESNNAASSAINVIIRTMLASILGYIISGNFNKKVPPVFPTNVSTEIVPTDSSQEITTDNFTEVPETDIETNDSQVIVLTFLGSIALISLIVAENFGLLTQSSSASISQLRDIVCSCIGFLIGCPPKNK